jgi:hypothetical protein
MTGQYFETSSKKGGRGMARQSLDLIGAMYAAAARANPITGRGVGYKLFVAKLIESMATNDMQRVYRLLKEARERGIIPWEWIVDETRALERVSTWSDPAEYAKCVARSYRRDFWDQQPHRIQVWSEKGTVRGLLRPVLDTYAVGFNPVHGFTSATSAHDAAMDDDGAPCRCSMSATMTRAACACPPWTCRSGSLSTAATTSSSNGSHLPVSTRAVCRHSRPQTRGKTRGTGGSSPITAPNAGNSMLWTQTIYATACKRQS